MKVSANLINNSKKLRTAQTPWEAKLWKYLRGNRFHGFKFKRQVPVGSYIADFCCHPERLVIELDGGQHSEKEIESKDRAKTEYLNRERFKVIRFWNNEIDQNIEGALETIRDNLSPSLSPHFHPKTEYDFGGPRLGRGERPLSQNVIPKQ